MKLINEIMHRLIFHLENLHNVSELNEIRKTDDDVWQEVKHWCSQHYKIVAGEVGWAINFSYDTTLEQDKR